MINSIEIKTLRIRKKALCVKNYINIFKFSPLKKNLVLLLRLVTFRLNA